MTRVQIPAEGREGMFPLLHYVQTSSEAHSASYTVSTRGSYPEGKVARV